MKVRIVVVVALAVILSILLAPSIEAKQEKYAPSYETPGGESFEYYFEDAYWQLREYKELGYQKAWTLTLVPNRERSYGIFRDNNYEAWNYVVARFSRDYRWENEDVLRRQFMCHCRYSRFKRVWNIEPWRDSMNIIDCN